MVFYRMKVLAFVLGASAVVGEVFFFIHQRYPMIHV